MFFSEEYEPRLDDYNEQGNLSLESILKILENCGRHHSQKVNDRKADNGIAWVLADWRVQISRRSKGSEKLYLTTWVHGKAPASAICRDFLVTDQNQQECIRASARFALVDLGKNRLTRISPELFESYGPEEKRMFEDDLPKMQEPDSFSLEHTIQLRRSDIDYNGHVHNTRYLDFAMEALPEEYYRQDGCKSFRINYRNPVMLSDHPVLRMKETETGFVFGIYVEEKLYTMIEIV